PGHPTTSSTKQHNGATTDCAMPSFSTSAPYNRACAEVWRRASPWPGSFAGSTSCEPLRDMTSWKRAMIGKQVAGSSGQQRPRTKHGPHLIAIDGLKHKASPRPDVINPASASERGSLSGQRFPATGIARLNIPSVDGHHFRAAGAAPSGPARRHHADEPLRASRASKVTASSAISVRGISQVPVLRRGRIRPLDHLPQPTPLA
ncbi:MAG: hypothetical protein JWR48_7592, partial [Mycobacterium sp.]|nr:hypothetical protein [Mycobacterium sp.]